jgi:TetR/AcrR family transcriptional regulator, copper-responsive repressor
VSFVKRASGARSHSNADPAALAQIATATLHTIAVRSRVGEPRQQLVVLASAGIDLICGTKKS